MSQSMKVWLAGSVLFSGMILVLRGGSADDQVGSALGRPDAPAVRSKGLVPQNLASRAAEVTIRRNLQIKVTAKFERTPLNTVLTWLTGEGKIPLYLDDEALREDGISPDVPITETLKNVPIEQALNVVLEELGLTWLIHDEVLKITTIIEAEGILYSVAYDVSKIGQFLPQSKVVLSPSGLGNQDGIELRDVILTQTNGPWEEIDGDGGVLELLNDVLIIRQNQRNHTEIDALIRALELCVTKGLKGRSLKVQPANYPVEADKAIRAALRGKTTVAFKDKPLSSVAKEIGSKIGISIVLDTTALAEDGISPDEPITISFNNITLASALKLMLEPYGLIAVVDHGALKLTTVVVAESHESYYMMLHDVTDLIDAGYGDQQLTDAILNCTAGPWEETDGDGGLNSGPIRGILFIRHCDKVHQETLLLLHDLRQQVAEIRTTKPKKTAPINPNEIVTRFYPTLDNDRAKSLSETLKALIASDSWGKGSQASIHIVDETMVVRQTRQVHEQITDFLNRLRDAEQESVSTGRF